MIAGNDVQNNYLMMKRDGVMQWSILRSLVCVPDHNMLVLVKKKINTNTSDRCHHFRGCNLTCMLCKKKVT